MGDFNSLLEHDSAWWLIGMGGTHGESYRIETLLAVRALKCRHFRGVHACVWWLSTLAVAQGVIDLLSIVVIVLIYKIAARLLPAPLSQI